LVRSFSRRWIGWLPCEQSSIAIHVLIVLFQRCAEKMAAPGVCDKVEKLGVRRSQSRSKRNLSGIADWPGW
jgi:hypothetical protein